MKISKSGHKIWPFYASCLICYWKILDIGSLEIRKHYENFKISKLEFSEKAIKVYKKLYYKFTIFSVLQPSLCSCPILLNALTMFCPVLQITETYFCKTSCSNIIFLTCKTFLTLMICKCQIKTLKRWFNSKNKSILSQNFVVKNGLILDKKPY